MARDADCDWLAQKEWPHHAFLGTAPLQPRSSDDPRTRTAPSRPEAARHVHRRTIRNRGVTPSADAGSCSCARTGRHSTPGHSDGAWAIRAPRSVSPATCPMGQDHPRTRGLHVSCRSPVMRPARCSLATLLHLAWTIRDTRTAHDGVLSEPIVVPGPSVARGQRLNDELFGEVGPSARVRIAQRHSHGDIRVLDVYGPSAHARDARYVNVVCASTDHPRRRGLGSGWSVKQAVVN